MATVIKAGQSTADREPVQRSVFNFNDMARQADQYVGDVQSKANQLVDDARQEAERIRTKAREEGRGAAVQQAFETLQGELLQQWQTVRPAITELVGQIDAQRDAWLRRWEDQAVHLACAIAEKVIRSELKQRPEITVELVREALQMAAGSQEITVCLHPSDHQALGDRVKDLASDLGRAATARVVSDPSIHQGGALVKTKYGEIDQQITTQLQRIEEELTS